jgi:hypothetical protein
VGYTTNKNFIYFEKSIDKSIYLCYNIYTRKEKEINKMTVKLWVDWERREILTTRQLDKRVDESVERIMSDEERYNEYLDDYIDCNYTKMEFFEALTKGEAFIRETIDGIKSGVAENISDWCYTDIYSDYEKVVVEV